MPISIALGLSVLTYLFILSDVDPKMVGLEAVHQHRPLRDHGDPVLHPGRQFSHHRRRRAPHDRFRHLADRALVWRARPGRRRRLRAVCRDLRLLGRDRRRHRLDHAAGDVAERLSAAFRRRRDHDLRRARHPVSAVDQPRHLRGRDQRHAAARAGRRRRQFRLGRPAFHRRHRARPHPRRRCSARRPGIAPGATTIRAWRARAGGECCARLPRKLLGLVADRPGARRHLFRAVHADRSRRRGGGLRLLHRGVRLQGTEIRRSAGGAAQGGVDERDDPLHHHQRGGVLLAADLRANPAIDGRMDDARKVSARSGSCWSPTSCCSPPATSWIRPRSS